MNGWGGRFGQYQNNMITQIDSRMLIGTGPRFKLVKIKASVCMLPAFSCTKERRKNKSCSKAQWSPQQQLYFVYLPAQREYWINQHHLFSTSLEKFRDFRILNQITLGVKATQHFSLEVKWNYLHDRFPAGDAPRTTYLFATGLKYEL